MRKSQSSPSRAFRIGLLVKPDLGVRRDILRGVAAFAESRRNWELELVWSYFDNPTKGLVPRIHGWIAWPEKPENMPVLKRMKSPGICVGHYPTPGYCRVGYDNVKIGGQIADYMRERGLRHFAAYCERLFADYSQDRLAGFMNQLCLDDTGCSFMDAREVGAHPIQWSRISEKVGAWLKALPKPVGILADTDVAGYNLMLACRQCGLSVPDEVAVVSVGADDLVCQLSNPRLSSVSLNGYLAGWKAAELLQKRLEGKVVSKKVIMGPQSLVERGSSNIIAFEDAVVVRVSRFVRNHFHEDIGVPELAQEAGLSRRALEKRFKEATGKTLLEEIQRVRLHQAEKLLTQTDLPIANVAEQSGYSELRRLSETFQKRHHQTPRNYRQKNRLPLQPS